MFARKVAARLRPNSVAEFTNLMECEVLPWLRKQEGFVDLIILAETEGTEVATISFWDHKGSAQACDSSGYPEVLKILAQLLDGAPYVKTFEVVSSSCHKAGLARPVARRNMVQETGSAPPGYRSYQTTI